MNSENPTCLFAVRDRQAIAYDILARTLYGNPKNGERGIDRLLDEDVYTAAFPLHDVKFKFHGTDTDTDTDILADLSADLSDTSYRVPVYKITR